MDKGGNYVIKVVVNYSESLSGGSWVKEVINRQKEQGFIKVEGKPDVGFILTEPGIRSYLISRDWIERIVEE
jgi:hypothetical protein